MTLQAIPQGGKETDRLPRSVSSRVRPAPVARSRESAEDGEHGQPRAPDGQRRVDHVVLIYVLIAIAWIAGSSALADVVAARIALPVETIEIGKGALFVLVTAVALRSALRRWAGRISDAAEIEHRAASELRQFSEIRTRFIRGVSHELRTPLTNIIGYGMTIERHGQKLEAAQLEQMSNRLVVNARRLERLVLDLLDLDRLVRGDDRAALEMFRVDDLVNEVLGKVPLEGHVLVVEAPLLVAELDRAKTERIIEELIRNVVRHTPPGTHIRVEVAFEHPNLRLTVADDGPGIDPEISGTVFEPFAQGDEAGTAPSPGLGIGLSLVRRYAEVQGGTVTLESAPGGGTRVDVVLPLGGAEDARS